MAKAGAVPPSKAIETRYRTSLYRFVFRTWGRIASNPDAALDDLVESISAPAIAKLIADSDASSARRIVAAIKEIGGFAQTKALATDVSPALALAAHRNAELITSITAQQRTMAAIEIARADTEVALATRLEQALDVSRGRARVIARDQVGKLNSELTELRMKAAGSERYQWSTSGDERVRATHIELDGQIYSWGDATGAEDGLPPGQPILCRCVAIAVFD